MTLGHVEMTFTNIIYTIIRAFLSRKITGRLIRIQMLSSPDFTRQRPSRGGIRGAADHWP